ncbi:TrbC/VirB2 family protein [Methylotenera sp. G11]|uniref:TrbC/VirB2 family protein n=1 Tax=Methylotenera sp. G11 TaxID=1506585 RepID=UPI00068A15DE|nr:TrbC/VirB2 family protein [Methylotenera sp. G11]
MRITNLIKNTKQAFSVQPSNAKPMSAIDREQKNKQLVKFVLTSAAVCLIAFEPTIAAATTGTGTGTGGVTTGLEGAANNILGLFTGALGKAVATIAVVVMGLMAMFGKLEWERAFKLILGIAIVFGASAFIKLIAGSSATISGI